MGLSVVIYKGLHSGFNPHFSEPNQLKNLTGEFKTVTYNVAGLPEFISQSKPSVNMPIIGKKLSQYALALVQEDFWYSHELEEHADFTYKNNPVVKSSVGDGLGQFSQIPLVSEDHEAWQDCHGIIGDQNDCLTPKGFSFSKMEFAPGVLGHVYNLHLDAGESAEDEIVRSRQLRQLATYIKTRSEGYPLIVAGDFNFHLEKKDSADLLPYLEFLKETGLTDACYATHCSEERLDRILYRSNPKVFLTAKSWNVENDFKDKSGESLSDHEPVAVNFTYQINLSPEEMQASLVSYEREKFSESLQEISHNQ